MTAADRNRRVIAALVLPGVALLVLAFAVLAAPIGMRVHDGPTGDPVLCRSLRDGLGPMGVTIMVHDPIACALAAALSWLSARASRILRTAYFVPAVLSLVIAAKLSVDVFHPSFDVLDEILRAVGLDAFALSWLSDPRAVLVAVVWIIVWQVSRWPAPAQRRECHQEVSACCRES